MASPNGLWTAVSGGVAQNQNIDVIANNIANSKTVAFKKDEATFKEYLAAVERPMDPVVDIPRTAFRDSDFYHHDGRENAMVILDKVHTDHAQGHFRSTGGPFDVAIDGPGYFAVRANNETLFTRAGDFKINGQGVLVTTEGLPVLGVSPDSIDLLQPPTQSTEVAGGVAAPTSGLNIFATTNRQPASDTALPATGQQEQQQLLQPIVIPQTANKIVIAPSGKIYDGETLIGALVTAEFPTTAMLSKQGQNLFKNEDPANIPRASLQSKVAQGFLEQSNVNTVSELVNLMRANRMFEGSMKAIRAYNDMATKEANEVGKL